MSTHDRFVDLARRDAMQGRPVEIAPGRVLDVVATPARDPDADTPTIFFSHGGGGNKAQWRYQFHEAVARGFGAVAWDALGHGDSPDADDARAYHGTATLADYAALVRQFGTARNILVGHSMGGRLTLALLASGLASGVERAVVIGSAAPGHLGASTSRGVTLFGRMPPIVLRLARPAISAAFRRRAWDCTTSEDLIAAEQAATRRNRMSTLKTLIANPVPLGLDDLARIDIPILVITGQNDRMVPSATSERLAAALPQARLVVIRHAAHQVMVERPAAVNAALFDFSGA